MNPGDIVVASIRQADSVRKPRPTLILRELPGFGDLLICGISTQLHQLVEGLDEVISPDDDDFASSGLVLPSLIRLSFLGVVPRTRVSGVIGRISSERHERMLKRLSDFLVGT